MSHAEGEKVELLPAPDKMILLLVCTLGIFQLPSGETLAHDAESGDFS